MIRPPPRSTLKLCRRQRQMCIRDRYSGRYILSSLSGLIFIILDISFRNTSSFT
nr:hypothetical protein [Pedobacter sp. ASV2]